MTSIDEYVSYGISRELLIDMFKESAATKGLVKSERIYIGIKNDSILIPDGNFGKLEKRAGKPIRLFPFQENYDCPVYFYEKDTNRLWSTGNGNATLSPWDCTELLASSQAVDRIDCSQTASKA